MPRKAISEIREVYEEKEKENIFTLAPTFLFFNPSRYHKHFLK